MITLARVAVAVVALLHVGFLVLEMFLWSGEVRQKVFRHSAEAAGRTALLAKNQGLYNGFLAAGLGWGLWLSSRGAGHAREVQLFFLGCVLVAGVYGAATVSRGIFFVQALPAIVALGLVVAG
jgi:putative membrane protein